MIAKQKLEMIKTNHDTKYSTEAVQFFYGDEEPYEIVEPPTGYVFVPYIMVQNVAVISESNFQPRMTLQSRYSIKTVNYGN